jgi:hypothetical protein
MDLIPDVVPDVVQNKIQNTPASMIALDRAIGVCIDFIAIGLVAFAPCLFRYLKHPMPDHTFGAIANDYVMFGCFCLAFSPLPLLYLRFVFRRLLRSPTPGEMFAGTVTISHATGLSGVYRELLFAMLQYYILALGTVIGSIAISVCLQLNLFGAANTATQTTAAWSTLPLFPILSAAAANWPRSKAVSESIIDYLCGFEVKRLR